MAVKDILDTSKEDRARVFLFSCYTEEILILWLKCHRNHFVFAFTYKLISAEVIC